MKSPSNEGDRVLAGHLLAPREASSPEVTGLQLIEFLSLTSPGCCQDYRLCAQTVSKASLLKTTPTLNLENTEPEFTEHTKWNPYPSPLG